MGSVIQATPPVPLGALRSPNILRGGQLVLTIPTNRVGYAAPLGDASDPLVRLEHSPGSCDGPVSACHEDTRVPWRRQPSQNTGYSLRLLGGTHAQILSTDHHRPPPWGPRGDLAGCLGTLQDLPAAGL